MKNSYTTGQQKYKRTKKYNSVYLPLLILILIFLFSLGFLFLNQKQGTIVMAKYGQIVDGFKAKGLIVREESVTAAPCSGKVYLKQSEGNRVSYGQEVMQIGNSIIYNQNTGLISYATDGLEKRLTPSFLKTRFSLEDFNHVKRAYNQRFEGNHLLRGEPAFRIVDNNSLYIVIQADSSEIKRYWNNEVVFVKPVNLDKEMIDGRVIKKIIGAHQGLLIIKLNSFVREWLNVRWSEVLFIKNIYRGIVIPREAVFTKPEGEGVLLYNADGSYTFREVNIVDGNQQYVVVEGLDIGENVLQNPAIVDFGKGV